MHHPMPRSDPSILIIIPVWNDASALRKTLDHLFRFWNPKDILVVDGGSDDDSVATARERKVEAVLSPQRGRARQMNFGAEEKPHEVLLFLHADTLLPMDAGVAIRRAIRAGCVGGAFRRRFDSKSSFLRITCRLANLRGRHFGWFLGDQAIFVHRDVFQSLGGFPELPLFEDLEFSMRMAKAGKTQLIQQTVISSGRRFEQCGPIRQTLRDLWLTLHYLRGRREKAEAFRNNRPVVSSSK